MRVTDCAKQKSTSYADWYLLLWNNRYKAFNAVISIGALMTRSRIRCVDTVERKTDVVFPLDNS